MLAFSSDFYKESKNTDCLKTTLAQIADAGFTHVHWAHEWSGDYTYSLYEMLQIKGWLKETGLGVKGIHATDGVNLSGKEKYRRVWTAQQTRVYTSENELNRLAGAELIKNRVDMAHELATHEIVLHMQIPYKDFEENPAFRDRYYAQACKTFAELEAYCKARAVRICLENLNGTPEEHLVHQFDLLFSRFDKDFLGFCFDTGHANITCPDCLSLARRYRDRIYCVHLCDNHGLSSDACWQDGSLMTVCDEHLLPYEGTFDWDGFAGILAGSPYKPPYVLETQLRSGGDTEAYLAKAFAAGARFEKIAAGKAQLPV